MHYYQSLLRAPSTTDRDARSLDLARGLDLGGFSRKLASMRISLNKICYPPVSPVLFCYLFAMSDSRWAVRIGC
jgi:hypothetical protein